MTYGIPHSVTTGYAQADVLTPEQDPFVRWAEESGGALVEALPSGAQVQAVAKRVPPIGWAFAGGVIAGMLTGIKPLVVGALALGVMAARNGSGAVSGYGDDLVVDISLDLNEIYGKGWDVPGTATTPMNPARKAYTDQFPEAITDAEAEYEGRKIVKREQQVEVGRQANLLLAGGVGLVALAGFFLLRRKR